MLHLLMTDTKNYARVHSFLISLKGLMVQLGLCSRQCVFHPCVLPFLKLYTFCFPHAYQSLRLGVWNGTAMLMWGIVIVIEMCMTDEVLLCHKSIHYTSELCNGFHWCSHEFGGFQNDGRQCYCLEPNEDPTLSMPLYGINRDTLSKYVTNK